MESYTKISFLIDLVPERRVELLFAALNQPEELHDIHLIVILFQLEFAVGHRSLVVHFHMLCGDVQEGSQIGPLNVLDDIPVDLGPYSLVELEPLPRSLQCLPTDVTCDLLDD